MERELELASQWTNLRGDLTGVGNAEEYSSAKQSSVKKSGMRLEDDLSAWIEEWCREPPRSLQRAYRLNKLFRDIHKDRRFWVYYKQFSPYYPEALSRMWRYFLCYLCVVPSGARATSQSFLETRDRAVPRLLKNLKGQLKNLAIAEGKRVKREASQPRRDEEGEVRDVADYLPSSNPLTPAAYDRYLELLHDPASQLRQVSVRGRPDVTMQAYLLLEYEGMRGTEIAVALQISYDVLYRNKSWKAKVQHWKRKLAEQALDAVSDRDE